MTAKYMRTHNKKCAPKCLLGPRNVCFCAKTQAYKRFIISIKRKSIQTRLLRRQTNIKKEIARKKTERKCLSNKLACRQACEELMRSCPTQKKKKMQTKRTKINTTKPDRAGGKFDSSRVNVLGRCAIRYNAGRILCDTGRFTPKIDR